MINNLYIKATPTTASVTWGDITGTLSDQTDLQSALDAKFDEPTGTVSQYVRGDGSLATFPSLTGYVPYTGATADVDLGTHTLSAKDLVINHSSGSGVAASITKGGAGEALTVNKTSGSGNAMSVTGGVTQLDELHLTTDLDDAYIASAATWNGKQDALILTTTGTSGAATLVGSTLNIPQYSGGGGSANPSVIAASYVNGTAVTGTTSNTISQSLLIPANTFTENGMLEVLTRATKTGVAGGLTVRIYKNTTNSLTGATLIGSLLNSGTNIFCQGLRTFRINSNTITGLTTSTVTLQDYNGNNNASSSTTFTTSLDNYIIFSVQLGNAADTAIVEMARAVRYI